MTKTIYQHYDIILYTFGITLMILTATALLGIFVFKQRSDGMSFRDSLFHMTNKLCDGFWGFVFLPWTIFKGMFFTLNGSKNPDGSTKRANFSMTRTIFALA